MPSAVYRETDPINPGDFYSIDNKIILHFIIEDTGIGIPEDKLERIFDSFTQVDGSLSRNYDGVGLGLTISKQLVEMMGGKIWVISELGKRKCFSFYPYI